MSNFVVAVCIAGRTKIVRNYYMEKLKLNISCGQLLYFSGDLNGHFAGGNLVIFRAKSGDAIK